MFHRQSPLKPVVLCAALCLLLSACIFGSGDNGSQAVDSPSPTSPSEVDGFAVDAGEDVFADEGSTIQLSVSIRRTAERSVRSIQWTQADTEPVRATFPDGAEQANVRVELPQVEQTTRLSFKVTVVNDLGQTVQDGVSVTVNNTLPNRLPVARLTAPQRVSAADRQVRLDGCASTDPDGQVTAYTWRRLGPGSTRELEPRTCTIDAPLDPANVTPTDYTFELVVTDNAGARSAATTAVVQQEAAPRNGAPVIQSVSVDPQPTYTGDVVVMTATATDPDGNPIQYLWTQDSGDAVQLSDKTSATVRFVAPARAQPLRFRVQVRDASTTVADADSRLVDVSVGDRPKYAPVSPQQCLRNPALEGCGAALKHFIPANPLTPGLGLTPVVDSAGVCTPDSQESWPHFWGALHEHTAYSDGTALTKPADVYARVASKGFDFAISTDHSDNLGLPIPVTVGKDPQFCLTSPLACALSDPEDLASNFMKWDSTAKQAQAATHATFTAMRGFEWTSDRFGHANVLFSTHYINPKTGPGYLLSMDAFWAWFLTPAALGGGQDGVMLFNHPGREDALHSVLTQTPLGGDPAYVFNDLAYIPAADYRVVGIEVFGKGDEYDTGGKKGSWLAYGLDKGWYLGAAGSEDHHGTEWGEANLPKTVLIARTRQQADLREALLARRFYAVAQNFNDLKLDMMVTDSRRAYPMGSRISTRDASVNLQLKLSGRPGRNNPIDPAKVVFEVLSSHADNSEAYRVFKSAQGPVAQMSIPVRSRQDWLFVRVRDSATKAIVAVSSPVWVKPGSVPLPACNPSR